MNACFCPKMLKKSLKALAFFNDFVRKQLIPKKLIIHTQYTSARKKGISLLYQSEPLQIEIKVS